jgi:hypothetical protein
MGIEDKLAIKFHAFVLYRLADPKKNIKTENKKLFLNY